MRTDADAMRGPVDAGDGFVRQAADAVDRLRRLDLRCVSFGADKHRYRFNPPLSVDAVSAFEKRYSIKLPDPYRRYVTELGNGGPGPEYGVMPLGIDAPELLGPFPFDSAVASNDAQAGLGDDWVPGAVQLADCGCMVSLLLVVQGAHVGQVWVDDRWGSGVSPALNRGGETLAFDSWWLGGMLSTLQRFESVAAAMRGGTPLQEIRRTLSYPGETLDWMMLSIMDVDLTPSVESVRVHEVVEDHYRAFVRNLRA